MIIFLDLSKNIPHFLSLFCVDDNSSSVDTPPFAASSATPTAAPDSVPPTILFYPLVLSPLPLPAPYPLTHISDTTSTSVCASAIWTGVTFHNGSKGRVLFCDFLVRL